MSRTPLIAAALLAATPVFAQSAGTDTPAPTPDKTTAGASIMPEGILISAEAVEDATVYSLAD